MASLTKLFSPIKIGTMELRNRLVMSPMTTQYANQDETPSQRLIDYYEARARGGVGLITVEVCTVDRPHKYQPLSLGLWDDKLIASHQALTKAIHAHGAKVVPQISHPGPESLAPLFYKIPPVGPSIVTSAATGLTCRELALEEIETAIEQYGEAARRAREAGYDGMEIHCAHSYMLAGSFLSSLRNKRTDAYNGSTVEGRLKFPIAVIKSMKARAGHDFPLTIRISGDERAPGARDIRGTQQIAPMLVEAGVDAFHVSGGVIDDNLATNIITGSAFPDGLNVPAAAAIKKVVDVPIMVVGRIHDPQFAEDILQKNQADLIVMGRPMLADPELPRKAAEGRWKDIRRCISCHHCFDSFFSDGSTACAINAATGKEGEYRLDRADRARKVMVIGGGPAGMEAARGAALRGHKVTLYEKQQRLGGSLTFACTVHSDNDDFLKYLVTQMKRLPVEIKLGREVTPELVENVKPDVVIVALGPNLVAPSILGDGGRNVLSGPGLKQMLGGHLKEGGVNKLPLWQRLGLYLGSPFMQRYLTASRVRRLTKLWMPVGKRVVVVGGDLAGCELAVFLAERGRKVTIVEGGGQIAPEVGLKRKTELEGQLQENGVTVMLGVKCEEILPKGVIIASERGEKQVVEGDTVILAGEVKPNLELSRALEGRVPEIYVAGDCAELGLIKKAVADAMSIACKI
ncbi:MAG: FAD-dependent oxidoreductase [Chloroflexi bacterium]|nr:FAD-dependent oxidoreductase [Chloroflexota bacterium]